MRKFVVIELESGSKVLLHEPTVSDVCALTEMTLTEENVLDVCVELLGEAYEITENDGVEIMKGLGTLLRGDLPEQPNTDDVPVQNAYQNKKKLARLYSDIDTLVRMGHTDIMNYAYSAFIGMTEVKRD